jgi:hypothetical protein
MPSNGNKTRGRSAVTASEVPSPIHQIAMRAVTASIRCPSDVKPARVGIARSVRKIAAPVAKTTNCLLKVVDIKKLPLLKY